MHPASDQLRARPPLLRALARPKVLILACIGALAAFGWIYLGLILAGQNSQGILRALCVPIAGAAGSSAAAALTVAMWCAMVLAMMLPTAAPMVMTYADLAETAAAKEEPVVSPLVLTAGYIFVWLGAAVLLTLLQILLARAGELNAMAVANPYIAGAMFLAAGLYQFSSLKHACLSQCQHPFRFFFGHWTSDPVGVFGHRGAPGVLLSRLLLGDDAVDVRGRRHERRLDGDPRRRDGDREARHFRALQPRRRHRVHRARAIHHRRNIDHRLAKTWMKTTGMKE